MQKTNIAILGATGAVGQRFIELLDNHPFFETKALLASKNSSDKTYQEACNWIISAQMPESIKNIKVKNCAPEELKEENIEIVFSALPSGAAKISEPAFARAGYKVFSNASAFRMEETTPLMITEINAGSSQELIKKQQAKHGWPGFIITNPNCSTIILALPLKALYDAFGIQKAIVSTMQAISGAGYPGVSSFDILDNVLPYIGGEEEKVETEPLKILEARFPISANCNRVATIDGHFEDLNISLGKNASAEEVKEALSSFSQGQYSNLPTGIENPIIVKDDPNRPQPRLDRDNGNGMAITVGRVRKCNVMENGFKMTILGHNTIRGAAGQSVLNAEWWILNDK